MAAILSILMLVCWIVSLVCAIMVLIPLFKNEGVLMGILGIICGLYTFIWGWIKAKQYHLQKVMLIWTVALVAGIALQIVTVVIVGGMSSMR